MIKRPKSSLVKQISRKSLNQFLLRPRIPLLHTNLRRLKTKSALIVAFSQCLTSNPRQWSPPQISTPRNYRSRTTQGKLSKLRWFLRKMGQLILFLLRLSRWVLLRQKSLKVSQLNNLNFHQKSVDCSVKPLQRSMKVQNWVLVVELKNFHRRLKNFHRRLKARASYSWEKALLSFLWRLSLK